MCPHSAVVAGHKTSFIAAKMSDVLTHQRVDGDVVRLARKLQACVPVTIH